MIVGVPKEIKQDEYRVAMLPVGVEELTRAGHKVLVERGVEFTQPPAERPYGIEAILRDDSGNWYSFTERQWEQPGR